MRKLEMWKMEMPTEGEMLPKDKYSVFDRKVKRYRKGIHSTCWRGGDFSTVREGLTDCRGAEVDESQPETQSSGFLDDLVRAGCILFHDKSCIRHGAIWEHEICHSTFFTHFSVSILIITATSYRLTSHN